MAEPVNILDDVNKKLKDYIQQGHHVPGVTVLTELPEFVRPSIKVIQIDTNFEKGKISNEEVYSAGGGKFAFGRLAIQTFAAAGRINLSIVGNVTVQRTKDIHRYTARICGERLGPDGTMKRIEDEKTYDLDVRGEEVRRSYEAEMAKKKDWSDASKKAYVDNGVAKFMILRQKFAPEMAITGAQARVVTKMLGLKPAYTIEELTKPFVIVSMTPVIDMKDPDIKRMVTGHLLGIRESLYPHASGESAFTLQPDKVAPEIGSLDEALYQGMAPHLSEDVANSDDFEDYPRGTREAIVKRLLGADPRGEKINSMEDGEIAGIYRDLRQAA